MVTAPSILMAKVMHKRLLPKVNAFTYGIYYLVFPFSQQTTLDDGWRFGFDRPGILSFYQKDHGKRDGSDLSAWIKVILVEQGVDQVNGEIILITLPRVLGYVFNPVSFWLCLDKAGNLRAVLCEVNNTFGESHSYLCVHEDQRIIQENDILQGEKLFHVSPLLQREGHYSFRFALKNDKFGVWIDYTDHDGKKLLTSLTGNLLPYTRGNCRKAFWRYPLVTYRAVFLIHWQAVKLLFKGIRYISKPLQYRNKLTIIRNMTKI